MLARMVVVGVLAACGSSLAAQHQPPNEAELFYATCLANQSDFARVEALAAAFKWRGLPDEMLTALGPQKRPDRLAGWLIPDKRVAVAVSEGKDGDGRAFSSCTLFFRDTNPRAVIDELLGRYRVSRTSKDDDGFQEYQLFRISISGIVHSIFASYLKDSPTQGSLSIGSVVYRR
jgi:hypothetical protein